MAIKRFFIMNWNCSFTFYKSLAPITNSIQQQCTHRRSNSHQYAMIFYPYRLLNEEEKQLSQPSFFERGEATDRIINSTTTVFLQLLL